MNKDNLSSAEALSKLKRGNQNYLEAKPIPVIFHLKSAGRHLRRVRLPMLL